MKMNKKIYLAGLILIFLCGCSNTSKQAQISPEGSAPAVTASAVTMAAAAEPEKTAEAVKAEEKTTEKPVEAVPVSQKTSKTAEKDVKKAAAGNKKEVKKEKKIKAAASPSASKKPVETKRAAKQAEIKETKEPEQVPKKVPLTAKKQAVVQKENEQQSVTITIYDDQKAILSGTSVKFKEGETVFEVLKQVVKENKIQMEFSGKESAAYVEGINNLYEFDKGSGSGWMYSVNGIYPNKSCGAYKLKAGDQIEWHYTLNLGKDLGAQLK